MKKILMVIIGTKDDKKLRLNIVIIPIICNTSDERDIKHSLESRKNDARVLLAIMTRHLPDEIILAQKSELDNLKCVVEKCDILTAEFIDVHELEAKVAAYTKDSVLHNYCPN